MQSLAEELLGRLGMERPIVCAPMAGGLAGARLAAAVSRAGGLGSVGMLAPAEMLEEIVAAKREAGAGRPIAAGLLVRFMRPAHVEAVVQARPRAVVLHDGSAPSAVRRLRAA